MSLTLSTAIPPRSPSHPPGTAALLARQEARESAARTYARTFRMVPVHAAGMTVTGADGQTYLDCLSGAGALALGHNHPVVVEAVTRVIERGAPWLALDLATPEKDEFTVELDYDNVELKELESA